MSNHVAQPSVLAAVATLLAYSPEMLSTTGEQAGWPGWLNVVCFAGIFTGAPLTIWAWRRLTGNDGRIGILGALLQLPLAVLLMILDVRVEIARGYFTADSSEAAMSYGIGSILACFVGALLAFLVWWAGRVPTHRHTA